jgi:Tfp pilus assembly protein PilO
MLSITANFEGTYADLMSFVNQLDRMKRLVILESLQAQPVQGSQVLAINMKLDTFFRFEGPQESLDEPLPREKAAAAAPVAPPSEIAKAGGARR